MKELPSAQISILSESCVLDICGFKTFDGNLTSSRICSQFSWNNFSTPVPFNTVSAISCGCAKEDFNTCKSDVCTKLVKEWAWRDLDCALLFLETNCQTCWYKPKVLKLNETFATLNSYTVKSLLIRPRCAVINLNPYQENARQPANGFSSIMYFYRDIEGSTFGHNTLSSDNFTCQCNPIVSKKMMKSVTPSLQVNSSNTIVTSESHTARSESHQPKISSFPYYYVIPIGIILPVIISGVGYLVRRKLLKHGEKRNEKLYKDVVDVDINGKTNELHGLEEIGSISENQNQLGTGAPQTEMISKDEILSELKEYIRYLHESSKIDEGHHFVEKIKDPDKPLVDMTLMLDESQYDRKFEVGRENFQLGDILGSGQFGVVYKGLLKHQDSDGLGEEVAIKATKHGCVTEAVVKSFLREIKTLSYLDFHENIVRFLGSCCQNIKKGEIYILTEFCDNGSLKDYLQAEIHPVSKPTVNQVRQRMEDGYIIEEDTDNEDMELESKDLSQLLQWAKQIANGMEFLNSNKIVHVDVATRNILLSNLIVKICDFGLSKKCLPAEEYVESLLSGAFPANSIAPECLKMSKEGKIPVTLYKDTWAYGCALWELFSLGKQPYSGMNIYEIYGMLCQRKRLEQPEFAPDFVSVEQS